MSVAGEHLAVVSTYWHALHIFNTLPTSDVDADVVKYGYGECSRAGLNSPQAVVLADGRLVVADTGNNRVLIWNAVPRGATAEPDLVLGQSRFDECFDRRPANNTLMQPAGLWTDGDKLVVSDTGNHRILIWNSWPSRNGQEADVVLGQKHFELRQPNDIDGNGASDAEPSDRTLFNPRGVSFNGTALAVADTSNSRVLVWGGLPTTNFKPASIVLGQADFEYPAFNDDDHNGVSDEGPTGRTMNGPTGAQWIGDKLLVTDTRNNRILVFTPQ